MAAYALGSHGAVFLGVYNGEGANSVTNRDSTVLVVGRVTSHPIAALDIGVNAARYGSGSTRHGGGAARGQRAGTLKAGDNGQHRTRGGAHDHRGDGPPADPNPPPGAGSGE